MNTIEKIRDEIQQYFDPDKIIVGHDYTSVSPNKKYRLESTEYRQTKPDLNWTVAKIKVFDNINDAELRTFYVNDGRFFYTWIEKDKTDYLICPEDLYGGQTVLDLSNNKLSSYSPETDGFIWTKYCLSPDKKTIGIIGCKWAWPYELRLYEFEKPLELPLIKIKTVIMKEYLLDFFEWKNNSTISIKNFNNELIDIDISTAHNSKHR